jgi:hypothetical protein
LQWRASRCAAFCHRAGAGAAGEQQTAVGRRSTDGPNAQNGPHAATIEQHTHHAAGSAGSECIACHMPKIAETIGDVMVRSHTFRFVWPAQTDTMKIPNACNLCHTDKTTAWATAALRSWADRSPWRAQ